MSPFPRYLRICTALISALLLGVAALNFCIDPLQHYRAATYPPLLVEQGRFRLPGLARHVPKEIIIAGTSVSKMQRPADVRAVFGKECLTLAMDGASAHEQYLIVRLALRTGRVKEVIWDINYEFLRGDANWVSDFDGAFPAYLYDENPINDVPNYLLSLDTAKNSAKVLASKAGLRAYPLVKPESFQEFPKSFQPGADSVAKALERRKERSARFRLLLPQFTDENLARSFQQNYVALVREFPNVKFHFFFPPFSEAYFRFIRSDAPELIAPLLNIRKAIFESVAVLPNAELHDIQSDIAMISDLSHYADPIHFDREYHLKVIEAIRSGSHRASAERLDAFTVFLKSR